MTPPQVAYQVCGRHGVPTGNTFAGVEISRVLRFSAEGDQTLRTPVALMQDYGFTGVAGLVTLLRWYVWYGATVTDT